MTYVNYIEILVGLALLAFGRKGLGLLLGAVGFFAGLTIATHLFSDAPSTMLFIAALIGGGIGIFIAFFVQKVAVVVAGVLGGAYTGYVIAMQAGWGAETFPWIPMAAGAVIGVILAYFIVKWALILLSSLFGAYLVVHAIHVGGFLETIIFIALVVGGILFQARSGKPAAQPQQQ
jgi:hypothetical protein